MESSGEDWIGGLREVHKYKADQEDNSNTSGASLSKYSREIIVKHR